MLAGLWWQGINTSCWGVWESLQNSARNTNRKRNRHADAVLECSRCVAPTPLQILQLCPLNVLLQRSLFCIWQPQIISNHLPTWLLNTKRHFPPKPRQSNNSPAEAARCQRASCGAYTTTCCWADATWSHITLNYWCWSVITKSTNRPQISNHIAAW